MEDSTCEICGRKNVRAVVSVEGAKLVVCGACARGKKVLYFLEEREPAEARPMAPQKQKIEETEEIREDYAQAIRKAREKTGLPISVVAERINEMESYLERIERGKIMPTFTVAKKLEKELGIKLIEKVETSVAPTPTAQKKFSEPTLGDMLEEE